MVMFSSLNPYQSLEVIESDSAQDLIVTLKAIRTPVKIINIVSKGTKFYAFVMGDVRKKELKQNKKELNLKGD